MQKEKIYNVTISLSEEGFKDFKDTLGRNTNGLRSIKFSESERRVQEKLTNLLFLDLRGSTSYDVKYETDFYLINDKELETYYVTKNPLDFLYLDTQEKIINYESREGIKLLSTTKGSRAMESANLLLANYFNDDTYRAVKIIVKGLFYEDDKRKVYRINKVLCTPEEVSKEVVRILTEEANEGLKTNYLRFYISRLGERREVLAKWNFNKSLEYDLYTAFIDNEYLMTKTKDDYDNLKVLVHTYLKIFIFNNREFSDSLIRLRDDILYHIKTEINDNKVNVSKLMEDVLNYNYRYIYFNCQENKLSILLQYAERLINFCYEIGYYDSNLSGLMLNTNEKMFKLYEQFEMDRTQENRYYFYISVITNWLRLLWLTNSSNYPLNTSFLNKYSHTSKWLHSIISIESTYDIYFEELDQDIIDAMMDVFRFRFIHLTNARTLSTIFSTGKRFHSYFFYHFIDLYFEDDVFKYFKDKKKRNNIIDCVVRNAPYSTYYRKSNETSYELKYENTITTEDISNNAKTMEIKKSAMRCLMKENLKKDQYEE